MKPLPCPFCSSKKVKPLQVDNDHVYAVCYQCLNCNSRGAVIFGREVDKVSYIALQAWNSRGKIQLTKEPPEKPAFGVELVRVLPNKPAYFGWRSHFKGRR